MARYSLSLARLDEAHARWIAVFASLRRILGAFAVILETKPDQEILRAGQPLGPALRAALGELRAATEALDSEMVAIAMANPFVGAVHQTGVVVEVGTTA